MGDYDDIKAFGKEIMERYGWTKLVDFNTYRRTAKTFVDQLWLHKEKKLWLFIEEKYGTDTLKENQLNLLCLFLTYAVPGMLYRIVSTEEDWQEIAEKGV